MQREQELTPIKRFFNILKEEKNQVYAIYFYAVLNGDSTNMDDLRK